MPLAETRKTVAKVCDNRSFQSSLAPTGYSSRPEKLVLDEFRFLDPSALALHQLSDGTGKVPVQSPYLSGRCEISLRHRRDPLPGSRLLANDERGPATNRPLEATPSWPARQCNH